MSAFLQKNYLEIPMKEVKKLYKDLVKKPYLIFYPKKWKMLQMLRQSSQGGEEYHDSSIGRLPVELVDMILAQGDFEMLYNFGIAYPYAMDIVKRRINKLKLRMKGSSAPVDLEMMINGISTKEGRELNKYTLDLLGVNTGPWLLINPLSNEILANGTEKNMVALYKKDYEQHIPKTHWTHDLHSYLQRQKHMRNIENTHMTMEDGNVFGSIHKFY